MLHDILDFLQDIAEHITQPHGFTEQLVITAFFAVLFAIWLVWLWASVRPLPVEADVGGNVGLGGLGHADHSLASLSGKNK